MVGSIRVVELGAVTRALLEIARDVGDDRSSSSISGGLDVDGAAISLLTASARKTCATP